MTQHFSLLSEPWIPVLRADGSRHLIRPAAITSDIATNPIVAPAWGRADFDAATREFWIGLLATACGPRANDSSDEWEIWFRSPPSPDDLDLAFAALDPAFALDGNGPRFGQDLELNAGKRKPIAQLLMETIGEDTINFFVSRDPICIISPAAAAIALFTFQIFARQGGNGLLTSLRGAGPLVTLIVPPPSSIEGRRVFTLWRTLWLSVPQLRMGPLSQTFPWMGPTRTSGKKGTGETVFETDGNQLQVFWPLPRRVRLNFERNTHGDKCDLTGEVSEIIVKTYEEKPWGTRYGGFIHPLTPHYRSKDTEPFLAQHGQPGRIGYRHWVGLISNDRADGVLRRAAPAVTTAIRRLSELGREELSGTRFWAAGYDIDGRNKAREFIESEMPLHLVGGTRLADYDRAIRLLVAGAREADGLVRFAVRQALFVKRTQTDDGFTKAPKDGGALDLARARFWERTEAAFGRSLTELAADLSVDTADPEAVEQRATRSWLAILHATAVAVFDELVSLEDLDALDERSARARIEARNDLYGALRGYGKLGQTLFGALGLATPDVVKKRKAVA